MPGKRHGAMHACRQPFSLPFSSIPLLVHSLCLLCVMLVCCHTAVCHLFVLLLCHRYLSISLSSLFSLSLPTLSLISCMPFSCFMWHVFVYFHIPAHLLTIVGLWLRILMRVSCLHSVVAHLLLILPVDTPLLFIDVGLPFCICTCGKYTVLCRCSTNDGMVTTFCQPASASLFPLTLFNILTMTSG